MQTFTASLFLYLGALTLVGGQDKGTDGEEAFVTFHHGVYSIKRGPTTGHHWVAHASYKNEILTTGWAYLEITTNKNYSDSKQAYAAGLLEGDLTAELIDLHRKNMVDDYCDDEKEYCARLRDFMDKNLDYLNNQINENSKEPYWHQVSLVLKQVSGIEDGKARSPKQPRTRFNDTFGDYFMNMFGELEDMEAVLNRTHKKTVVGDGSCSALIKLLPDNKDIYMAHASWTVYSQMLRVLKKYNFHFHTSSEKGARQVPGRTVSFSSYPGHLFSGDDYYLLSSGLAVMETTLTNGNKSLWKYITPETVFEWTRNIVANRLATDGDTWTEIHSRHNSGTYNNHFMVLNYGRFKAGQKQEPGLLWVLEQMPGNVERADVTDVLLNQTYWASYNTPYFQSIFVLSGGEEKVAKYGTWFDYEKTPRAQIFRRDNKNVVDMDSMMKLMRSNDFEHDPLSRCNCTPPYSAANAISARGDLNDPNGTYPFAALGHRSYGAIDLKMTNSSMFQRFEFVAVGGPIFDPLPPFQWSTSGFNDSHDGQPDLWKFEPIIHLWQHHK